METGRFTTLNTTPDRVGEILPMRFGPWSESQGAVDLQYLGYDSANAYLWYLASAQVKSGSSYYTAFNSNDVISVYLDGIELESFTSAVDDTGNYSLLVVKVSLDEAGRYGILDDNVYRSMQVDHKFGQVLDNSFVSDTSRQRGGRGLRPSRGRDFSGARPLRKLTANIDAPYSSPVDFFEYILDNHGPGIASRDSTSYAAVGTDSDSYMKRSAITCSHVIDSEGWINELFDVTCEEVGLEQYITTSGTHALEWVHDSSALEEYDGFDTAESVSDLDDIVGEPQFQPLTSGDLAPVNAIEYIGHSVRDMINDSTAETSYGYDKETFRPEVVRSPVLARALCWDRIQQNKTPRSALRCSLSCDGINRSLGERVLATVRSGPGSAGWSSNIARVRRMDYDPLGRRVMVDAVDEDHLHNTGSAYMRARADLAVATLTADITSAEDWLETATDASDVEPGDFVYYESSTSGSCLCARVTNVILDSGTYYIFINREPSFSAAGATVYVLRKDDPLMVRTPTVYHKFEGASLPLVDEMGTANFTSSSGTINYQQTGKHDYSIEMVDGSYIYIPDFPADQKFSISFWIWLDAGYAFNGRMFENRRDATNGWLIDAKVSGNTPFASFYGSWVNYNHYKIVCSPVSMSTSAWNLICVAFDEGTDAAKIWCNGSSNEDTTSHSYRQMSYNSNTPFIWSNDFYGSDCKIDSLRYWSDYYLTDDDVTRLLAE